MITKVLSAMSSKADGVAMLESFRAKAGHGTYLESVFTTEFMVYVKRAILDDVSPDIAADLDVVTKGELAQGGFVIEGGSCASRQGRDNRFLLNAVD